MPDHPPARWSLPDRPDLRWLRRRAKSLRDAANDPGAERHLEAIELLATYDPAQEAPVSLARAQRVLARAYGFAGWSGLREHLAVIEEFAREVDPDADGDDDAARFLRLACLSYTVPAVAEQAAQVLRRQPELALASACTMAAAGRADELAALLSGDPGLAVTQGGPHRWEPILYLCYSRIGLADPSAAGDPEATLAVLLAAGADPNSGFLWHGLPSPFTALTGVLGGGERDEPPHPAAVRLAEMLLRAGADPNDNQALYNRMFRPDDSHLPPLLEHGLGTELPSPWRRRLGTAYPSPEEMLGEHLRSAAEYGFSQRVRLLLEHRVDPNTRGYHPGLGDLTAYEVAVRNGQTECADLLAAAGGVSARLDPEDLLVGEAMAGHAEEAARRVADDPDLVGRAVRRRPEALAYAAERRGLASVALLVQLGFPVDSHARNHRTALHEAALRGDIELCRWLVARGADLGIEDREFSSTPAGWAEHAGHQALADELAPPPRE